MKVLLFCHRPSGELGSPRPSVGVGYVGQALEDAGIEHHVIDLKFGYSPRQIVRRVARERFDLVGCSVYTVGSGSVLDLLAAIKRTLPHVTTFAGGPHISLFGRTVLEQYRGLDVAFQGEAEQSVVQFCQGRSHHEVPGLLYRVGTKANIAEGPPAARCQDLDQIRWPRYSGFQLDRYGDEIGIVTSRGCPYSCIFCAASHLFGKKIRVRSPENIGEELAYWHGRGYRTFNFLDDNVTFHRERILSICDEIQERGLSDIVLRASNGLRADHLDRQLLSRLKEVGLKSFALGVESGSDRVLKLLKKGGSVEQTRQAIQLACEMGFDVTLFFVYGAPGETVEEIDASVQRSRAYPVFRADFSNLVPYPGTALWDWVNENDAWTGDPLSSISRKSENLSFSLRSAPPLFVTRELDANKRRQLAVRLRRVTIQNLRRGLQRKLVRFGPLKTPLSHLAATTLFQRLYWSHGFFARLSDAVRFRR